MISFIFNFKAIWIALLLFVSFEGLIYSPATNDLPLAGPLFEFSYNNTEVMQKVLISLKINKLKDKNYEIIQVGDSSGLHGIKPKLVMEHLDKMRYLNASCCGDTRWDGYRYLAEVFLRSNVNRKYLLLHFTPFTLPARGVWWNENGNQKSGNSNRFVKQIALQAMWRNRDLGKQIYEGYLGPARIVHQIPSLEYRLNVTNLFYYGKWTHVLENELLRPGLSDATQWAEELIENLGWVKFQGGKKIPVDECEFKGLYDDMGNPTLRTELQKIKSIADKYSVKFIVITNPVACLKGEKIAPVLADFKKFTDDNPDVIVPLDFYRKEKASLFGDKYHLREEGANLLSHRVGRVLKKILKRVPTPVPAA